MSLRQRLANWIAPTQRLAVDPMDFYSSAGGWAGVATTQPSHETLLRESIGTADNATRAIANRLSGLELQVKVKRGSGGTQVEETLDDHPLKALLDKPHPDFSAGQLLRLTAQHILTVGEAYWLKVGNQMAVPTELHPMPPGNVEPRISQNVVQSYQVRDGLGRITEHAADSVVRFFFPDPESMWGAEGYLSPAGITVDSQKFAGHHLRSHYENDATPKSVLEAGADAEPFTSTQAQQFWGKWKERFHTRTGTKSGLPAITPTGYKLVQFALQSGADVAPLLAHWRDDVLMNFFTPRSVLGQVVSGDRSSAETNQYVFDRYGVLPIATLVADSITLQLAGDFDAQLFVDWAPFISADEQLRLQEEAQDAAIKVRTVNHIREDRGLDPVAWGEQPVGAFTDTPYTGDEPEPPEPVEVEPEADPEEEEEEERLRTDDVGQLFWLRQVDGEKKWGPLFFRALRRLFQEQLDEMLERLYDAQRVRAEIPELFSPEEWVGLFELRLQPIRENAFVATATQVMATLGQGEFTFTDAMRKQIADDGAAMVTSVLKTTRKRIANVIDTAAMEGYGVEKIARELRREMGGKVARSRTRTIARTETLRASSAAQVASYTQAGVEYKKWNTSRDARVRHDHKVLDGVVVPAGEPFTVGGSLAAAPRIGYQGGFLPASQAINCRCFLTPVLETPETLPQPPANAVED